MSFRDLSRSIAGRLQATPDEHLVEIDHRWPGVPERGHYAPLHVMRIRPYIGILCGFGVGVLAVIIWMLTFQPHGGVELSRYLFPLSALALERVYPTQSIPVSLWYGGALLQWLVVGALVDLLRRVFRRESRHDNAA
ncbi:MAG TPA: hypothetical protein VNU68_30835 [Verrucomicrobiae bacterium]|nr:hypothetical protein [Verrucomicrobiae bacterium]